MATARDLITASLTDLAILHPGETLSAADGELGRAKLNRLLSEWNAHPLGFYAFTVVSKVLTISDSTYTIGSGQDIDVSRPNRIVSASLIRAGTSPVQRMPVSVIRTVHEWSRISMRNPGNSIPAVVYWDEGAPTGTIHVYPPPAAADTLELYVEQRWTEFSTLDTPATFADGWESAIVYNLCKHLAPPFGVPIAPEIAVLAASTLATCRNNRTKAPMVSTDDGQGDRSYAPSNLMAVLTDGWVT